MTRFWAVLNRSRHSGRIVESHSPSLDNRILNNGRSDLIVGYFLDYRKACEELSKALRLQEDELSIKQAANLLTIDHQILRHQINAGILPAFGPKHRRRIRKSDLLDWATNQKRKPA